MLNKTMHISILAESPEINSSNLSDFISIYDLQNAVIKLSVQVRNHTTDIFQLNEISLYTGYQFSRETVFKFNAQNKKENAPGGVYTRIIKAEEIR